MHRRPALRSLLLVVALTAAAACSGDGGRTPAGTYALLRDEGWTLRQAVDPPADDPGALLDRPPHDWYAEYVRTVGNEGQLVRLTGHRAGPAEARGALEAVGFVFDDVEVEGWRAVGGVHPRDTPQAKILLLDHGGRSVMALSYELDLAALGRLAGGIEAADQATWTAAGGIVR